jgi:hypothetical protein
MWMAPQMAEAWVSAWEAEADARGLERLTPDYWDPAAPWIVEQYKTRKVPK